VKRKAISLKTKLASALLMLTRYDKTIGISKPFIGYEQSKTMTADEIIARFDWDHTIAHAHGGPDEPWNLTPMLREDHREKTSKIDVPRIAKSKRIQRDNEEHARRMLEKIVCGQKPGWPKRKWPKRKIQSRNTLRRER
jgi:hypothetical protein